MALISSDDNSGGWRYPGRVVDLPAGEYLARFSGQGAAGPWWAVDVAPFLHVPWSRKKARPVTFAAGTAQTPPADIEGGHSHWYRFTIPKSGAASFKRLSIAATADLNLALYKGTGTTALASWKPAFDVVSHYVPFLSGNLSPGATYYLKVTSPPLPGGGYLAARYRLFFSNERAAFAEQSFAHPEVLYDKFNKAAAWDAARRTGVWKLEKGAYKATAAAGWVRSCLAETAPRLPVTKVALRDAVVVEADLTLVSGSTATGGFYFNFGDGLPGSEGYAVVERLPGGKGAATVTEYLPGGAVSSRSWSLSNSEVALGKRRRLRAVFTKGTVGGSSPPRVALYLGTRYLGEKELVQAGHDRIGSLLGLAARSGKVKFDNFSLRVLEYLPPLPAPDEAATADATPVAIDVLANDNRDSDALAVRSFSQGARGTVTSNPGGTLTYTPAAAGVGSDSFTYTAGDGKNADYTASVTVELSCADTDTDGVCDLTEWPECVGQNAGNTPPDTPCASYSFEAGSGCRVTTNRAEGYSPSSTSCDAMDTTCADYGPAPDTCDGSGNLTPGTCGTIVTYAPPTTHCGADYTLYGCTQGNDLGKDIFRQVHHYQCNGAGSCVDNVGNWTVQVDCTVKESCAGPGTPTQNLGNYFCAACADTDADGVCDITEPVGCVGQNAGNTPASTPCTTYSFDSGTGCRVTTQRANGYSPSSTGCDSMDTTCADYGPVSNTCDGAGNLTLGTCGSNVTYAPTTTNCGSDYTLYSCNQGNDLGDDIFRQVHDFQCNGAGSCLDNVGGWTVQTDCAADKFCSGPVAPTTNPADYSCAACVDTDLDGVCDITEPGGCVGQNAGNTPASTPCTTYSFDAGTGCLVTTHRANGYSPSSTNCDAMDTTCADYGPVTNTCDGAGNLTLGACGTNVAYASTATNCGTDYTLYGCTQGNDLGDDIFRQVHDYQCNGAGSCVDNVGSWTVQTDCTVKQSCAGPGTPTQNLGDYSCAACVDTDADGVCDITEPGGCVGQNAGNTPASTPCTTYSFDAGTGCLVTTHRANGYSPSSTNCDAMDTICADYGAVPNTCDGAGNLTLGTCGANVSYASTATNCGTDYTLYGCNQGNDLGKDIFRQVHDYQCNGAGSCVDNVGSWTVQTDCTVKQSCAGPGTPTQNLGDYTCAACADTDSDGVCDITEPGGCLGQNAGNTPASTPCTSYSFDTGTGCRVTTYQPLGYSPSSTDCNTKDMTCADYSGSVPDTCDGAGNLTLGTCMSVVYAPNTTHCGTDFTEYGCSNGIAPGADIMSRFVDHLCDGAGSCAASLGSWTLTTDCSPTPDWTKSHCVGPATPTQSASDYACSACGTTAASEPCSEVDGRAVIVANLPADRTAPTYDMGLYFQPLGAIPRLDLRTTWLANGKTAVVFVEYNSATDALSPADQAKVTGYANAYVPFVYQFAEANAATLAAQAQALAMTTNPLLVVAAGVDAGVPAGGGFEPPIGHGVTLLSAVAPLFHDGFTHPGLAADPDWQDTQGRWRLDRRRGRLLSPEARAAATLVSEDRLAPWAAGAVEVSIKPPADVHHTDAALIFGRADARHYRYVAVRGGEIVLGQVGEFGGQAPGVLARAPLPDGEGAWCRLRLVSHLDGTVEVFLDGATEPILTHFFPEVVPGRLGLRARGRAVSFDEFDVWGPDVLSLLE